MHNSEPGLPRTADTDPAPPPPPPPHNATAADEAGTGFTELRDDVTALVEDARTYAVAEIAFQKTRAGLAGKHAGRAAVLLVLALVLLHIALIALAVGAVIALAPLVTIWGAIGIVVGVMLLGVGALVWSALGDGKVLGAMFAEGGRP
jgi:hypothetical protein